MRGVAENDGYNALVLAAGLRGATSRSSARSRASCARSACPIRRTTCGRRCASMPAIAAKIVELFHARFDPGARRRSAERARAPGGARRRDRGRARARRQPRRGPHPAPLRQRRAGGDPHQLLSARPRAASRRPAIAIKFDSRKLDGMPLPRPLYEIFVYSPRVEGVHLRFGKVARGGIRWSDRPQDFRTEILGLVKAQQVKNAVIVPVGAKGGFVPKHMPAGDARGDPGRGHRHLQAVHVDAARHHRQSRTRRRDRRPTTSCATTTTIPISWSPPTRAPRPSPTSPTASPSEHGFWLGDAFASGGSAGYDHKKMGITARGAWESVKRHFREMDVDIGRTPFTVVGVGDMSGDVFGNGMLRERTIQLVAAFDHRDIFIDPDPDPERASPSASGCSSCRARAGRTTTRPDLDGRRRVLARAEGDRAVAGGAGGARLCAQEATPQEVMNAILQGAGRSAVLRRHRHLCARLARERRGGRRPRQRSRSASTGGELRCKVIGEGANLGMTQRGRIEAALARRPAQHRRDRQFGRRQHLRRRGQHQDRAEPAGARRAAHARRAATRCSPR